MLPGLKSIAKTTQVRHSSQLTKRGVQKKGNLRCGREQAPYHESRGSRAAALAGGSTAVMTSAEYDVCGDGWRYWMMQRE